VERLIEAFALVAGRIQHKIDDEFPELSNGLLSVLYPHYLAPIPSVAIVQFEADPSRLQLPAGFTLPRESRIRSQPIEDVPCRFRTGYPVTLWPIRLERAQVLTSPFPPELRPPPRTAAVVRLSLECQGGLDFSKLELDRLRFFLTAGPATVAALHEFLFHHATRVDFRPLDAGPTAATRSFDPAEVIFPVGFDLADGLLPYPAQAFRGYRLLSEFFAFPAKFHFLDLGGFRAIAASGFKKKLEVVIYLNRMAPVVSQEVTTDTFRLGCAPAINLFEQVAEPINLSQSKFEYRITPDVAAADGLEIYSIESVTGADLGAASTREYLPFYSFRHGRTRQDSFWFSTRRPSSREGDRGTDVFIGLVDSDFDPRLPAESALVVRTLCTNRSLPEQLAQLGDRLRFDLDGSAPVSRVRCVRSPSPPLRPPMKRGATWRLISHLSLNHLSLNGGPEAAEALREVLRLYDFTGRDADKPVSSATAQLIEGLVDVASRRVLGRVESDQGVALCRGTEITLTLDESKYVGTGTLLFAAVLERFLALYATLNSFTQLAVRSTSSTAELKRWPPRVGEIPLL
jgi:type VI secretion system protein ImpG